MVTSSEVNRRDTGVGICIYASTGSMFNSQKIKSKSRSGQKIVKTGW